MTRLGRQFQWKKPILRVRDMTRRRRMDSAPPEVAEEVWRKRSGASWIDGYWDDFRSPRRDHLMGKVREVFGVPTSVLDVGCNVGPNLRRIAEEFPGCRLSGFDINEEAIEAAERRLGLLGLTAELQVGSFYEILPTLPADSVDLVISSFSLAYIPPAHLGAVLTDIVRIARWGLVLEEPVALDDKRPAGVLTAPWYDWRHDFASVFGAIGHASPRLAIYDLPVPGAPDSGLLVLDLRNDTLIGGQ